MRCLHILNGEGTHQGFKKSGVQGDIGVWNEALCQGPAPISTKAADFQATRLPFLLRYFEATQEQADSLMAPVWEKLTQVDQYDEVTLWFEYDLFCQTNLLYLCHWLWENPNRPQTVSLVSPANHPSIPDFRGMGQLQPGAFPDLWESRIELSEADLHFGHQTWLLWSNQDLKGLHDLSWPQDNWPHLQAALAAMLGELPHLDTGLASSESFILQQLDSGPQSPGELFQAFSQAFNTLGYGDLQFFQIIEGLEKSQLVRKDETYLLSDQGRSHLASDSPAKKSYTTDRWVGPCLIKADQPAYFYDAAQESVV